MLNIKSEIDAIMKENSQQESKIFITKSSVDINNWNGKDEDHFHKQKIKIYNS